MAEIVNLDTKLDDRVNWLTIEESTWLKGIAIIMMVSGRLFTMD